MTRHQQTNGLGSRRPDPDREMYRKGPTSVTGNKITLILVAWTYQALKPVSAVRLTVEGRNHEASEDHQTPPSYHSNRMTGCFQSTKTDLSV